MFFKNIQDHNAYFQNITQIPPLRATLWFVYRLSLRYLLMQARNIYVLFLCFKNIQDLNSYFEKFIQISPLRATSDSCIACICNIFECNCATSMCLWCASRISKNQTPILKIYPDFTTKSPSLIQAPPVLAISSNAIVLHLCASKRYKTRVHITKIP